MDENENNHSHKEQGIFIQNYSTIHGEMLRNRNIQDDESSYWSDSQNQQSTIYYTTQQNNENGRVIQDSIAEQKQDNNFQMNAQYNSITEDQFGFPPTKQQQIAAFCNQKPVNEKKTRLQCAKSENAINDSKSQFRTNKKSFGGMRKIGKSQNNNFISMKKYYSLSPFLKNLVLLTKIKLKIQGFYRLFTNIYRTRLLTRDIRLQIRDKSDIFETKNSLLTKWFQFFERQKICLLLSKIPLCNISTNLVSYFDFLICLLNIVYFIFLSLFIFFDVNDEFSSVLYNAVSFLWVIEIMFRLNLQIYSNTDIVSGRVEIIILYMKQKALYDFIPLISHFIQLRYESVALLMQIIQCIKIHNIYQDIKDIQLQLFMRIKQYYLVQLFNLICKLFLIGHFIACLWYMIGKIDIYYLKTPHSWITDSFDGDNLAWWKLYIASLYWALSLMATGSNISTTVLQASFTSFILLFTSIAFGYIITEIGLILSDLNQKSQNLRREMSIINEYMRQRNISKNLQAKVNLNLQAYYENNLQNQQQERLQVLNKISVDLKDSLLIEQNKVILSKIDVFQKYLSPLSLSRLSLIVREEYYLPYQIINYRKEEQDQHVIFILQGEIELFKFSKKDQMVSSVQERLKEGDVFGLINFVCGIPQDVSAKATMFTKIARINRSDFLRIIKNNKNEFQQFSELKDKILNYQLYKELNMGCSVCNSFSHLIQNCNIVNIDKAAHYQWLSKQEKQNQKRQSYQRRRKITECTLISQTYNEQRACNLIETLKIGKDHKILQMYDLTITDSKLEDSELSKQTTGQEEEEDEELIHESIVVQKSKSSFSQLNHKNEVQSPNPSPFSQKRLSLNPKLITSEYENENNHLQNTTIFFFLENKQRSEKISFEKKQVQKKESIDFALLQSIEPYRLKSSQNILDSLHCTKDQEIQKRLYEEFFEQNTIVHHEEKGESSFLANSKKMQTLNSAWNKRGSHQIQSKLSSKIENDRDDQQQVSDLKQYNSIVRNALQQFIKNYPTLKSQPTNIMNIMGKDKQIQNIETEDHLSLFLWKFDLLKDYKHYFPDGNSKEVLIQYMKYRKKRIRSIKIYQGSTLLLQENPFTSHQEKQQNELLQKKINQKQV